MILADYIAKTLKEQLATQITDRDALEADSAHKVFEKVVGWFKLFAILIVTVASALGVLGGWKIADWSSSVDKAKTQVLSTAVDIKQTAEKTKVDMAQEVASLKRDVAASHTELLNTAADIEQMAAKTKLQMAQEADSLKSDVAASRTELQAAKQLEPEMESLRQQLAKATTDIQAQQKVISSSENFVKAVFSTHVVELFHVGQPPDDRYAIVPPAPGGDKTTVFLLLKSSPIPGTLQVQYHIFVQPPNSYFAIHNMVIYFWGQSIDTLKAQQLSVSYFPDNSDKNVTVRRGPSCDP